MGLSSVHPRSSLLPIRVTSTRNMKSAAHADISVDRAFPLQASLGMRATRQANTPCQLVHPLLEVGGDQPAERDMALAGFGW